MAVEFSYRLTGRGWSLAEIADGQASATLGASYLTDALGDLLEAVLRLFADYDSARCSWQQEPGEFRWIFDRDGQEVRVRILKFPDAMATAPDGEGSLVFETAQPLAALGRAIADGARRTLSEYGEDGYLASWVQHPFPTRYLDLLTERLRT